MIDDKVIHCLSGRSHNVIIIVSIGWVLVVTSGDTIEYLQTLDISVNRPFRDISYSVKEVSIISQISQKV